MGNLGSFNGKTPVLGRWEGRILGLFRLENRAWLLFNLRKYHGMTVARNNMGGKGGRRIVRVSSPCRLMLLPLTGSGFSLQGNAQCSIDGFTQKQKQKNSKKLCS